MSPRNLERITAGSEDVIQRFTYPVFRYAESVDTVARQIVSDMGPPTSGTDPDNPSAFVVPLGALFFAG